MNKVIKMVLHDRKMTRRGNAAIKMVSKIEKVHLEFEWMQPRVWMSNLIYWPNKFNSIWQCLYNYLAFSTFALAMITKTKVMQFTLVNLPQHKNHIIINYIRFPMNKKKIKSRTRSKLVFYFSFSVLIGI